VTASPQGEAQDSLPPGGEGGTSIASDGRGDIIATQFLYFALCVLYFALTQANSNL